MELNFFSKGILLGFAIAAPVGPIGILCIRKTLQFGRWSGFFSGLGAAIADTLYGAIAAFGLSYISKLLLAGQNWLRLIGGAFLLYLGIKTFFAKREENKNPVTHKTLLKDFFSTLFLTLTNPMTIISYLAVFAGIGLSTIDKNYSNAGWLVFGVFIGSSIWWLILSEGVTFFRKRVSEKAMVWINRLAGSVIAAFGIVALLSIIY